MKVLKRSKRGIIVNVICMNDKVKKALFFLSVGSLIVFALMTLVVITGATQSIDKFVSTAIPRSDVVTSVMKCITHMGDATAMVAIGVLVVILKKNKRQSVYGLLGLGAVAWLNSIIKKIIRRARPNITHLVVVDGFSFPSGHSTSSLMFYGFLIYIIAKNLPKSHFKTFLMSILIILVISIGFSRVYLGVHYLSDVLGGFALSLGLLSLYILWLERAKTK